MFIEVEGRITKPFCTYETYEYKDIGKSGMVGEEGYNYHTAIYDEVIFQLQNDLDGCSNFTSVCMDNKISDDFTEYLKTEIPKYIAKTKGDCIKTVEFRDNPDEDLWNIFCKVDIDLKILKEQFENKK